MRNKFFIFSLALCICAAAFAEEMPAGYYDAINGLQDSILKGTLKTIIRDHTVIPYGKSGSSNTWVVFFYSDRNDEGYIMDMYCDTWYKVTTPGEVASGCNIEHSFAKSWWGESENDAYKDCYHLNPSNSTANSSRSNYPLGVPVKDFKDASKTGSLKVGKIHHDSLDVDFYVFEPKDEYKGDFARAYFYMATCYGKDINGNYDPTICSKYKGWRLDNSDVGSKFAMQNDNYLEFQPWEQEVLITWHRQDPVSVKEIKRADAVSNFQHNRNPFIDYPYLAEYIWGERAGEELNMANLMASFEDDFVPGVSNGWREGGEPPTPKPKYGVTWSVNGETALVDSVVENKKISALPATPVSCSTTSNTFMGWTNAPISGHTDEAPATLYTKVADFPVVTEDVTFYAVFAKRDTISQGAAPKETTFAFTTTVATVTQDDVTVTFAQAGGSNPPKYYDTGEAIRCYAKNTITIQAQSITSITFTFGSGDGSNDITADKGTFETPTWTGNADKVVFTIGGNSGHRRIAGMKVVYNGEQIQVTTSRYLTSCDVTEDLENEHISVPNRKIMRDGQLLIIVGDQIYNILGQKLQ